MRVLLINSNRARDVMPVPPIGLGYLAEATRRAGHETRLLDLMPTSGDADGLEQAVTDFRPEVVGISVRNIDNVIRQAHQDGLAGPIDQMERIRRATEGWERPPALVVGGAAISILGRTALQRMPADFAVVGEGEAAFPALLRALESGGAHREIPGLVYRQGERIVANPRLPLARFGPSGLQNWIDWSAYEPHGATWPLQTKRGCSLACTYCAYPVVEGREHRVRPAAEVVDEIEEVARHVGPRTFEICDSTFNVPLEHALGLCDEILRRGVRANLTAMGISPACVSDDLFPRMRRAGFNSMMVTPESASDTMLRSLRKGFSAEQVHRTARLARASGLHAMWFFLLGGPGETEETVEETVSFLERELCWERFLAVVFTGIRVLPGTRLAEEAVAGGHLEPGTDLSRPVFFHSEQVREEWILRRLDSAIDRNPGILHAADEVAATDGRVVGAGRSPGRVAPPFWRFLPPFLRRPEVRAARRLRPLHPIS